MFCTGAIPYKRRVQHLNTYFKNCQICSEGWRSIH
jgi:hypothetical protein